MKSTLLALAITIIWVSNVFSIGQEWVSRFNGSGNSADWANAITLDDAGNVYITGYSTGATTGKDMFTIKYSETGQILWTATYNGTVNGGDYSYAITLDGSGNVYVTGRADFGAPLSDIVTIKYNSSGVQQWVARYNGISNNADEGRTVLVDGAGNVYVGGKTFVTGNGYDFVVVKYNSSGTEQWASTYNGPGNNEDILSSLALDNSGNVYVCGSSIGLNTGSDLALVKFNSDGSFGWVKRYNGAANGGDVGVGVKVGADGFIYCAGSSDTGPSQTRYDMVVMKYASDGSQQWLSFFNSTGPYVNDFATAMTLDANSNVYLTGASSSVSSSFDSNYSTVKFNNQGVQQWYASYVGPNGSIDVSRSICVDNQLNVFITGSSFGANSDDYVTIKYNPNGTVGWLMSYNGPASNNDNGTSVATDNNGNAYVTGRSFGIGTDYDYATIKYSNFVGINPVSTEIPTSFNLYQNYPNPFNPSTRIKFDLPDQSNVNIDIYNLIGSKVMDIALGNLSAATYEYNVDASSLSTGVYFYRINTGKYTATKKMMLVK